jgi:membrane protein DedA with SNARE-associated domain
MRLPLFTALTAIGSLVWNSALIIAGYLLGERWTAVQASIGIFQWVVLAAAAGAVVWFVVAKLKAGRSTSEKVK